MTKAKNCPVCKKKPKRQWFQSPTGGKHAVRFACPKCGIIGENFTDVERAAVAWNELIDELKARCRASAAKKEAPSEES